MTKRLYLAGPMSGLPKLNFPAFHAEAARLRSLGYEVVNPAELHPAAADLIFESPEEYFAHWVGCMRHDLAQLVTCDTVAMLDGWTASKGARLEHHIALELGMMPRLAAFFVAPPSVITGREQGEGSEICAASDEREVSAAKAASNATNAMRDERHGFDAWFAGPRGHVENECSAFSGWMARARLASSESSGDAFNDEQIVAVWQAMPGGPDGWLKSFGYIQFAREILAAAGRGATHPPRVTPGMWQAQIDTMQLLVDAANSRADRAERLATPAAKAAEPSERETGQVYGIVDPDYGRIYTMVRKLAWEEGYAIGLHGSFTRDLDLIAVPWDGARPCRPEKLVARVLQATGLREARPGCKGSPGNKPHGRLCWTLLLPDFGDPRFVDLSIMPPATDADAARDARLAGMEEAAKIAAVFGPSRPLLPKGPNALMTGRWQGEQAASSSIAGTIRAAMSASIAKKEG